MQRSLLISAILGGIVVSIFTFYKPQKNEPVVNKPDWNVIALPSKYTWAEQELTEDDIYGMHAYFDDRFAGKRTKTKDGMILFKSGKGFYTVVTDKEQNSFPGQELFGEIDKAMTQNGWQQGLRYDKYQITGMGADGPTGSIIGYVKLIGTEIRTIVYKYGVQGTWEELEDGSMQFKCPCKTTLNIHISDPVNITDILPLQSQL